MIAFENVSFRADSQSILNNVSFTAERGLVALIGPNGAGKSTLLRLLADGGRYYQKAHITGSLTLDNQRLTDISPLELAKRRAFLAQQHGEELHLPVQDLLCLATWPHGGDYLESVYQETLQRWELADLVKRSWQALSGGERQRAQLARTWMQIQLQAEPRQRIWILDEPQNALDFPHQLLLRKQLCQEAERGALVIFSTHDINFAVQIADQVLALRQGELVANTCTQEMANPALLETIFNVPFQCLTNPVDNRPWLIPG